MNVFEKTLAVIAPQAAVKRAAARRKLDILNSGYGNYGASHSKKSLKGWLYGGGSANEDIHDNLQTLRERSRDLYAGVPLATGAIKTMRTNVVGSGLRLKSQIDYEYLGFSETEARTIESKIEREFSLYADSPECDIERLDNFYELQQLAFINWLMSGDVVVLLPVTERKNVLYDIRIKLIEADRLCTPLNEYQNSKIQGGVEVNEAGEIVAYHIAKNHPLSHENVANEWTRVEAYGNTTGRKNVLLICNRERIGQRRGVPFLSPVIESLKQLGRYTDAELVAAVISGMFTVFIEKEGVSDEMPLGEEIPTEQQIDSADNSTIELAPGAIIDLNDGEKVNATNPGRPNANFDGFVTAICRQIGSALEIPFELLLKHFSSSYSASRGALLEAWKSFRMYREWLSNDFCQPIYEEWFSEAVAKGRLSAPGFFTDPLIKKAYCSAEWNGPTQGQLDPVKEVNAAVTRVKHGLSTHDKEAMEITGSNFFKNARQLKNEAELLSEVKKIENEAENNK